VTPAITERENLLSGVLADRVAVVTAAGSGMGRASAKLFAAEGATVVVVDLAADAARAVVAEIERDGGRAIAEACDVASVDQLRGVFDRVEREFGVLHVLFNHAGIPGPAGLQDVNEEEWHHAIDVNMKSAWFGTSFGLPLLKKADGKGSIIFTASTSGLVGSTMSPLYSMAKGGIVNFARGVALYAAADGIRANVICPGPIDTPMLPQFFGRTPEQRASAAAKIPDFMATAVPMGRAGDPTEIAQAALFLASDASSFITGVPLPVDGGYVAR
jgi:NAD(P)-dependent dehydrogenase (short-subunit alcohol dehydrogenase family)